MKQPADIDASPVHAWPAASTQAASLTLPLLASPQGRCVDSAALLGADGRLAIVHRGRRYELRETAQGKLILTA
ncbi:MAG: hemin uptake protein HemP [Burkholderiales bacterium]|nr:hemin uptake protein HemP [Burkholderiales bacterium]ODU62543.1 MAG: hypothetical protein ABT05_07410 [Lautropia sp. SCN 66-9]